MLFLAELKKAKASWNSEILQSPPLLIAFPALYNKTERKGKNVTCRQSTIVSV
jgi:hypothetical protein